MKTQRVLAICFLAAGTAFAQQAGTQQAAPQDAQPGAQPGGGRRGGGRGGAPRVIGPQPPVVDPGGPGKPPSDAIVLFNGRDASHWTILDDSPVPARPGSYKDEGKPVKCKVAGGAMTCKTGDGDIQTNEKFSDAQIHLEFMVPNEPNSKGYAKANGGVILQGVYEIQLLDSYKNPVAPDSQCAALYRQSPPLVNACRPPEQWQSYDIFFHAPKCGSDGTVQTPGSLTMLQNGVLVLDHVTVRGRCIAEGPLVLQDHSRSIGRNIEIEEGPVNGPAPETDYKYRNIWMRKLSD
ncbi:MAG: DUF1080 domain-containing protein [Bryobacteraceae bacterium]|jgi:hypothetical protein